MKIRLSLLVLMLLVATCARGQAWSGIIAPSRAIDWSKAGLPATFPDGETTPNRLTPPTRTTLCATIAPEGTAGSPADANTNLNPALVACAAANPSGGGYVALTCGAFYHYGLNGNNIRMGNQNNVTLKLCGAAVYMHNNTQIRFETTSLCSESNIAWSAGYAQGTTTITVANKGCMTPGQQTIGLYQCASGFSGAAAACNVAAGPPAAGTWMDNGGAWDCGGNINYCADQGTQIGGTGVFQEVLVTAVSGSGPYTFTISPGLYLPIWNAGNSPYASWVKDSVGGGVEDGTVDCLNAGNDGSCIAMSFCYACWVKGVRVLGGQNASISTQNSSHYLIDNSYVYTQTVPGTGSLPIAIQDNQSCDGLIVNNIVQVSIYEVDQQACGTVFAYNYARDGYSNSYQQTFLGNDMFDHVEGIDYMLREGNEMAFANSDFIHGTHFFETAFRNLLFGNDPPYNKSSNPLIALGAEAYTRYDNWVGNVLSTVGSPIYQAVPGSCGGPAVFEIGCRIGAFPFPIDGYALSTTMRWGNVDETHATAQFNSGEVPSGLDAAAGFQMTLTGSGTGPYTGTIANLPCIYGNNIVINGSVFGYDLSANGTITGTGISSGSVNCSTGAVTVTFSASTTNTILLNYLQLTASASPYQNALPGSHTLPLSFFLPGLVAGTGTNLPFGKVCTNYPTCTTFYHVPEPINGPDVTGGSAPIGYGTAFGATVPANVGGFGNDNAAAAAWGSLPIDPTYQNSYAVSSCSWSSGTETCNVTLPGTHSITGGFEFGTISGCSIPTGQEFFITNSPNAGTTIQFALASNPGACGNGTILYPDVRQFNEAVYQPDTAGGSVLLPLNLSLSAH